MLDKRRIIDEIKRIAAANGGKAPGREKFERETGIKASEWYPHHWLRWGEALQEAGFTPNKMQTALSNDVVFEKYIGLIRKLGRVPIHGELIREAKKDASFPSKTVFERFGGKVKLLGAVIQYCQAHRALMM
jgi:hypothetical protein